MKFHDTLNDKLWIKNEKKSTGGSTHYDIKPEVTAKLKEIAQAFMDYADIPEDAVLDIVLTGSSASYNYTPLSDIDLHLIVDYDKLHEDCPLVENYLWSVKAQFNKEHDISIYDIPVELYAEDKNAGGVSNGIYSIKNDEWVKKPKRIPPTDNDAAVLAKYNEFAEAIEKVTEGEDAEQLLDKIYAMRKSGLQDGGEFSVENLAFKKLRDTGLLEMLKEMKKVEFDKELSLEAKRVNTSGTQYDVTAEEVQSLWDEFYKENKDTLIQEGKKLFDTFEVEQGEELYDEPLCQTIKVYLTPDNKTDVGIVELGISRLIINGNRYIEDSQEFTEKITLPLFLQFLRSNGYSCTTENLYSPLVTDVQLVKGDIEFPETPMSQKEVNQVEEIKKFFDNFGIPIEYEGLIGNIYGSMKPAISGYLKNSILPLYLIIGTGNKYSAEFQAEGTLSENKGSTFYEELQSRFTDKEIKDISKRWSKKLKPCKATSIEEAVSTLYSQLYDNLKDYIDLPEDYRKFLSQGVASSSKKTRLSKVLDKLKGIK